MGFKKWQLNLSLKKTLYWSLTGFMVAYMLNACGDDFLGKDEESSASVVDPASINYIEYDRTAVPTNSSSGSNPSSISSSGGSSFGFSGGGTSSSGGSGSSLTGSFNPASPGGFANTGGSLDQGTDKDSQTRVIPYDNYDQSGFYYFAKMTEPAPVYTQEGKPFALQFVAIGKFPLKYTWYKESTAGRKVVGTDSTVFSKASAAINDHGKYYATVEDADGKVLTSRTVELKIRPSNKPCPAGNYGPTNGYDNSQLVLQSRMPAGYRHLVSNLREMMSSHTLEVECKDISANSSFETCTGRLLYQCTNEKYVKIQGQCYCYNDSGS